MDEKKIYFINKNLTLFNTSADNMKIKVHSDGLKISINDTYSAIRNKTSGNVYLAKLDQNVYCYPVDCFYDFKVSENQNVTKKMGIYLKKDVNYFLCECEDKQAEMSVSREILEVRHGIQISDVDSVPENMPDLSSLRKRIKCFIKDCRILTPKKLKRFDNVQEALKILEEMCIYVNGRYVLKNTFYEKKLHAKRDRLIGILKNNDVVDANEIKFLKDDIFLADELLHCCGNGRYRLKHVPEPLLTAAQPVKIDIDDDLHKNKVRFLLKKHMIITVPELCTLSGFDEVFVKTCCQSFFKVNENTFAFVDDELRELRIFILKMLKECSLKKNEIALRYTDQYGSEVNQSVLQKILKDYCNNKGGKWFLRYDE